MTIKDDDLMANGLKPNLSGSDTTEWHDLDWKGIEGQVKRLRQRIYSATRRGEKKKIAQLQRLMANSSCNVLSAIRRVTSTSSGRGTPGVDRLTFTTPAARMKLFEELRGINLNDWNPLPAKRTYIPKPDGSLRPLGIPTIKDRVLQGVILNAIEPEWEAIFESSSYGFRPGKTVWDATHRLFTLLNVKDRLWVVEADIKGCFDNIDHSYLMYKLDTFPFSTIISKWLKGGVIDSGTYNSTDMGTPQGGVISPFLSNVALDGLEHELDIRYDASGYITKKINPRNRTLVRYADDFIVLCPSEAEALQTCLDINAALRKRGLQLSETKTKITHTFSGFDFLGFTFHHFPKTQFGKNISSTTFTDSVPKDSKHAITTSITPSSKSVRNMSRRLSDIFHDHRGKSAYHLIRTLNPVIRGYCNSKRVHQCSRAMRTLNTQLNKLILAWIRRSHPKKSRDWTIERYFTHYRSYYINNAWTFRCPTTGIICQQFIWHSNLRRWPSVVSSYSPDDPTLTAYWKTRESQKFSSRCVDLQSSFDRSLADSQDLVCPVCGLSLLDRFELHRHHIIPSSEGGPDKLSNLLLLHLPCHHSIHYGSKPEKWKSVFLSFKAQCRIPRHKKLI